MNVRASVFTVLFIVSPLLACGARQRAEEQNRKSAQETPDETLPRLPDDKLPPATRPKPDPEKMQFVRDPVHVAVRETRVASDGNTSMPDVPVVENYLKEYFRRAGHPVVESPQDAKFLVEGAFESEYSRAIRFRDSVIAHRVRGEAEVVVEDADGNELERFVVPETFQEAALEESSAFRTLQRFVASLLWGHLFQRGTTFADPEIRDLLATLTIQNEADFQPLSAETIVDRLADRGLEAVPYLLEAMSDTSTVQVPSRYPGLEKTGPDALKVYHVADKALEEIFQKVSRLPLESPPRLRFLVTRAWEDEWRRFCKSYRESPVSRRDSKQEAPKGEDERDKDAPRGAAER